MPRHKIINMMHCADCFTRSAKKAWDYDNSPEMHERRRQAALVERSQMRAIEHNFLHRIKHVDCEFCVSGK